MSLRRITVLVLVVSASPGSGQVSGRRCEPAADGPRQSVEPLFSSGFESEKLDEWSKVRGLVAVAEPGLNRSRRALEVKTDGTRARSFVEARLDWEEGTLAVSLRLDARAVELGQKSVEILRLLGPRHHASLALAQEGKNYFVALWVREGDGALKLFGRSRVPADRAVGLELAWVRATSKEHDDGEMCLLKNGRVMVSATKLANGATSIESIRLGLPAGSEGVPAGGRFLLDDIVAVP